MHSSTVDNIMFLLSLLLLFMGYGMEWELPWPINGFLVLVMIVMACKEGGGNHPLHD